MVNCADGFDNDDFSIDDSDPIIHNSNEVLDDFFKDDNEEENNPSINDFNLAISKLHLNLSTELQYAENYKGSEKCDVNVDFRTIKDTIINAIDDADIIFGCVAWVRDKDLLRALSLKKTSLIIQKEHGLRSIRRLYDTFSFGYKFCDMPEIDTENYSNTIINPVRCLGNIYDKENNCGPRMHNKFLIYCKMVGNSIYLPYAYSTGSFNFTANSSLSLENTSFVKGKINPLKFYVEYLKILALSEPLDFKNEYLNPEWNFRD